MSIRRHDAEIIWLHPWVGFGTGDTYAAIVAEPLYLFNPERRDIHSAAGLLQHPEPTVMITDQTPCPLDCGDDQCSEWNDVWNDVWKLHGATRKEAIANLIARNYNGYAHHVSECEMSDDKPTAGH